MIRVVEHSAVYTELVRDGNPGAIGPTNERPMVSSVRITRVGPHAKLLVYVRGQLSGQLVMDVADCNAVATRLLWHIGIPIESNEIAPYEGSCIEFPGAERFLEGAV